MVSESSVFTVDPSTSFLTLFGENHGSDAEEALRQTAKQLLSVCATLGEDPIIRYQIQSEGGIHPQGSPAGKLARIVQQEVDNFCRLNPNFPVKHCVLNDCSLLILLCFSHNANHPNLELRS
jgi:syntaxin-binding protein 1